MTWKIGIKNKKQNNMWVTTTTFGNDYEIIYTITK
jgi:hypothetical protein